MMKMNRIFVPVGQGAFYIEDFTEGVVIYDCGSSTKTDKEIANIIDSYLKKKVVYAIFISHFHQDHISGIPHILKNYEVKNIFFPLMRENEKIIMQSYHLVNKGKQGDFIFKFIENPLETIREIVGDSKIPILYEVLEEIEDESEIKDTVENKSSEIKKISSGSNVANEVGISNWEFILFNFREKSRIEELEKKFKESEPLEDSLGEFIRRKIENNDLKNIQEIYSKIPGDLNTNSMTLFSGSSREVDVGILLICPDSFYPFVFFDKTPECFDKIREFFKKSGALYTGDYDAGGKHKIRKLMKKYEKYWERIGCLQLPHHGSKHNFSEKFLEINTFFVISAGTKNKYKHPHVKILKNLLLNQKIVFIVTEKKESELSFRIYI
ncbi:hypothetical protein FUSO6_01445 [Fusobacterium necrophorum DAB]|uniref:MBL fold metallo-hydrolase n=1 Tax=Fusobacterium necrophorum TaxID=859 RepID=UPI000460B519|nr:MBL fold metallo-hydrolase [Fusobacterium necrophorum]KDE71255.1 hypothetical protein FUSO6_01445 [Fusobacterium necrophorum DAB]MBR8823046.1 hypothetical protein [Fusobacterium necrophorum]